MLLSIARHIVHINKTKITRANYSRCLNGVFPGSFLSFFKCIRYTDLVNIIPLSGTHAKKEPLWELGSKEVTISALCSFLYILDIKLIIQGLSSRKMYKKRTFYTYAQILI